MTKKQEKIKTIGTDEMFEKVIKEGIIDLNYKGKKFRLIYLDSLL